MRVDCDFYVIRNMEVVVKKFENYMTFETGGA